MALLLYPNISGFEMVLFSVLFFNCTVAIKRSNPDPLEQLRPHLDCQGVRTANPLGWGFHTVQTALTRVQKLRSSKKNKKQKKKNQKALLIVRIDSQKISNCSSTAAASGIYIFQSSKSFLLNSLTICANICHQVKVLSPFTKTVFFFFKKKGGVQPPTPIYFGE